MFKPTKLSCAIALAMAVGASGTASAAGQLEEIVVTATKRSESAQDIPITVQALGEQALEDLGNLKFQRLHPKSSGGHLRRAWTRAKRSIYSRGIGR